MKYIYTAENCPKCEILKKKYKGEGVQFVERNADRIKQPDDEITGKLWFRRPCKIWNYRWKLICDEKRRRNEKYEGGEMAITGKNRTFVNRSTDPSMNSGCCAVHGESIEPSRRSLKS